VAEFGIMCDSGVSPVHSRVNGGSAAVGRDTLNLLEVGVACAHRAPELLR
jgi:hypothetical protein